MRFSKPTCNRSNLHTLLLQSTVEKTLLHFIIFVTRATFNRLPHILLNSNLRIISDIDALTTRFTLRTLQSNLPIIEK
jgi:hypothetical protein